MPVSAHAKFRYVGIARHIQSNEARYLLTNKEPELRKAHIAAVGLYDMSTCEFAPLPHAMKGVDAYKFAAEKLEWDLTTPPWQQSTKTNGKEIVPAALIGVEEIPVLKMSGHDLVQTAKHNLGEMISRRDCLQKKLANVETEIKLLEAIVGAVSTPATTPPKLTTPAIKVLSGPGKKNEVSGNA